MALQPNHLTQVEESQKDTLVSCQATVQERVRLVHPE
jgi:hypothetical protein